MYLKVEDINEIAKFSNDSVQPKLLKENGQERLMLIAIKKEQILATHTSPIDASIFVVKGNIEVLAENNKYEITRGHIFNIPANMPHSVTGMEDSYFFVLRM